MQTIPVKELIERGHVEPDDDKVNLIRKVLAFFGVCSVQAWQEVWAAPAVAARRSRCFESRPGDAAAWIRQGELQAQQIVCAPFDRDRFRSVLKTIRSLTREEPAVFASQMRQLCADAGVAVALVREMKKVPWNGATKWLSPDKVMILLSLRGKGEDKFWFSFFHEAGHVLKDNKKSLFINSESDSDLLEQQADTFAAEKLIPSKHNARVSRCRSKQEIIDLANELGISPGIVAGRYQFLTGKWQRYKELIRPLQWTT